MVENVNEKAASTQETAPAYTSATDFETGATHTIQDEKASRRTSESSKDFTGFEDDSLEYPTEEELLTLRRVTGKIPWIAYSVAFAEFCERFSYYGTTAVCMCSS
jgi:POT family proton-dependent oligopeptide transporter